METADAFVFSWQAHGMRYGIPPSIDDEIRPQNVREPAAGIEALRDAVLDRRKFSSFPAELLF